MLGFFFSFHRLVIKGGHGEFLLIGRGPAFFDPRLLILYHHGLKGTQKGLKGTFEETPNSVAAGVVVDRLYRKVPVMVHALDLVVPVVVHNLPFAGVVGIVVHIFDLEIGVVIHEFDLVIPVVVDEFDLSVHLTAFAFLLSIVAEEACIDGFLSLIGQSASSEEANCCCEDEDIASFHGSVLFEISSEGKGLT